MSERDTLDQLAERYRREGYEVILDPPPAERPSLADSEVFLLAHKGREYLVVHPPIPPATTTPYPVRRLFLPPESRMPRTFTRS